MGERAQSLEPMTVDPLTLVAGRRAESAAPQGRQLVVAAAVLAATLALSARLVYFIWDHAVNVLFWDQWDLYRAIMAGDGPWLLFARPHGPVRLGAGQLLTTVVANATAWDSRAESMALGAVLIIAALLALALKRRLFGSLGPADIAIPLIVLTTAQYENLIGTPFAAHPAAIALLMLFALAWTLPKGIGRAVAVTGLAAVLTYTAYGLFVAPVALGLLGLAAYRQLRAGERPLAAASVLGGAAIVAVLYAYTRGLHVQPLDCYRFPDPEPLNYGQFVAFMYAAFLGIDLTLPRLASLAGAVLLAAALGGLAVNFIVLLRRAAPQRLAAAQAIVALLGFSLAFSAATAVGRMCLGLPAAQSSRYMTLLIPAFLGLYLSALLLRGTWVRRAILTVVLLGVAGGWLPTLSGGANPRPHSADWYRQVKQSWQACYLRSEDVAGCNAATGYEIHPRSGEPYFAELLNYMRENRLSLYADGP
jgi:hypothetical protein